MVEMIEIPKIEYERMIAALEDAEDNAAVERHLRNPEVGMPAELVARMIDGEHPIAIHREWRGLSGTALAKVAGVNRVQLLQIEKGQKSGSIETLKRISLALDVAVDDLI